MQYSIPPILKNDDFVQDFVEKFAEYDAIVLHPTVGGSKNFRHLVRACVLRLF